MDGSGAGFVFLDPGELNDGVVRLHLVDRMPADPDKGWVPYYVFHIHGEESGHRAGEIHLRIGDTDHMRLYGGHIAYGVRPEYRGHRFAARAVRLVIPLAVRHGLSELWITCNPDNIASRRTCEAVREGSIDLPTELTV
jgi:tagatose 1,6-diphosphate aldolase